MYPNSTIYKAREWSRPRKRRAEDRTHCFVLILHTIEKKQVDAYTTDYHPRDEPNKRDLDKHRLPMAHENEEKQEHT